MKPSYFNLSLTIVDLKTRILKMISYHLPACHWLPSWWIWNIEVESTLRICWFSVNTVLIDIGSTWHLVELENKLKPQYLPPEELRMLRKALTTCIIGNIRWRKPTVVRLYVYKGNEYRSTRFTRYRHSQTNFHNHKAHYLSSKYLFFDKINGVAVNKIIIASWYVYYFGVGVGVGVGVNFSYGVGVGGKCVNQYRNIFPTLSY